MERIDGAVLRVVVKLTMALRSRPWLLLPFFVAVAGSAQELRPGVWAGRDINAFPLPVSGYDVYMFGEMHGVKETIDVLVQYLAKLYEGAGLRDVALEEKPAYQREAQAYIEGESDAVPEPLCLRAGVLDALRRFNEGRKGSDPIHVRLVDIDLNAAGIRQHLLTLKEQIQGTQAVRIPAVADVKAHGLETVAALQRFTNDPEILGQLRTVGHSIRAYQQGLEVGTGDFEGSPYLDDREDAILSNIVDLLRIQHRHAVLALYGNDHVSKTLLKNGGPKQDSDFAPVALRLEHAGIKVYSVATMPLAGRSNWRERNTVMWTASDGSLASGEPLNRVLASSPGATLLFFDPRREPVKLPSQDLTKSGADAFLLFAHGTPAEDRCAVR